MNSMRKAILFRVDIFNDPFSKFLFSKWYTYYLMVIIFLFSQLFVCYQTGTLLEIHIDGIPSEKLAYLSENAIFLPACKDISFISYYLVALISFLPGSKFFNHVPHLFNQFFENKVLKNRKVSTQKKLLNDFNNSLEKFEDLSNGKFMYIPAFFLFFLVISIFSLNIRPLEGLDFIHWPDIHFFPLNWITLVTVASLMWFVVGIFIWKMYCIVSFIRKLSKEYEFTIKPFNADGFGGFKPLGELWMNMIYIAVPIVLLYVVLFFYFQSFDIIYLSKQKYIDILIILLYNIFIVLLLFFPLLNYHYIVKNQKETLLKDIEKNIDKYYRKIEKTLLNKNIDKMDNESMEQLKNYHEIALKIKNIPSWPFTSSEKFIILFSTFVPWTTSIVNYLK